MSWINSFLNVAVTAMQREDLRQRLIYAISADDLPYTPGVAFTIETSVVLAIYEASFRLRENGAVLAHEHPYPGVVGRNPKRADLAFKEAGRGKNWWHIEVKRYSPWGVRSDLEKLQSIRRRAQRWLLVYRVRTGNMWKLRELLEDRFDVSVVGDREFPTFYELRVPGTCEVVLARVSR